MLPALNHRRRGRREAAPLRQPELATPTRVARQAGMTAAGQTRAEGGINPR